MMARRHRAPSSASRAKPFVGRLASPSPRQQTARDSIRVRQTGRIRRARARAHLQVAFAKREHGRSVQPKVEDHFSTLRERFALRQPALCHRADATWRGRALTCLATNSARCAQSQERSCALAPLPIDRPVDRDLITPPFACSAPWQLCSLTWALARSAQTS